MLALQMSNAVSEEVEPYRTSEELEAELRRKYGISVSLNEIDDGVPEYGPEEDELPRHSQKKPN